MCYEIWIVGLVLVAGSVGAGFALGLFYAKKLMRDLICENISMHKQVNECHAQLKWIKEVDKESKGDYNRRMSDKLLTEVS